MIFDEVTDDVEQLILYNERLEKFINFYRTHFIELLEEKKRVELILKMHDKE
jgi:hypothetical protein